MLVVLYTTHLPSQPTRNPVPGFAVRSPSERHFARGGETMLHRWSDIWPSTSAGNLSVGIEATTARCVGRGGEGGEGSQGAQVRSGISPGTRSTTRLPNRADSLDEEAQRQTRRNNPRQADGRPHREQQAKQSLLETGPASSAWRPSRTNLSWQVVEILSRVCWSVSGGLVGVVGWVGTGWLYPQQVLDMVARPIKTIAPSFHQSMPMPVPCPEAPIIGIAPQTIYPRHHLLAAPRPICPSTHSTLILCTYSVTPSQI